MTLIVASSIFVPILKYISRVSVPSDEVEDIYIIFSTPLICCSSGAATVLAIVSAFAPLYVAITLTCGGITSGYSSIGKPLIDIIPAIIIIADRTVAKIGLLIKNSENIFYSLVLKVIEEPDFNLVKLFVITISPSFNPSLIM